jgi:lipoprotein NlpD
MKASGFLWLGAGLALASCDRPLDMDFRSLGDGFSTTEAALAAPSRPAPDERGIIAYPTYQVVVARPGDTVGSIAGRLGFDAAELATYNGVPADRELRRDEIVALPRPVAATGWTGVWAMAAATGRGRATISSRRSSRSAGTPL